MWRREGDFSCTNDFSALFADAAPEGAGIELGDLVVYLVFAVGPFDDLVADEIDSAVGVLAESGYGVGGFLG